MLPTASALYFVAVMSGSGGTVTAGVAAASDGALDPVTGFDAVVDGFAAVPHADAMIALAAITPNKRFRI